MPWLSPSHGSPNSRPPVSEGNVMRRGTRRNLSTQPIPRGIMGGPTAGQAIRYSPISPDELAHIIAEARTQRTEEDIAEYSRRKTA